MAEELKNVSADCLIISANRVVSPYPVYPLGAAYIVKALNDAGHRTDCFDLLSDGGLAPLESFLSGRKYDLVGISIRNIDTVDSALPTEYLNDVVESIECVRRCDSGPVVLGGAGFSIMPEQLLAYCGGDYGIIGPGEAAVVRLAAELAAGSPPDKGLLPGCGEPVVFSTWPELSPETIGYYADHGGMLNIQTKRGCPYKCSYCSYPTIEGTAIRYRDPDEIAEEALLIKAKHGVKYLFFADSVFNDPSEKYLEIAEALIRKNVSLPWCAFFRPHRISREQLRLLKRSGLTAMELGTDAATDETLSGMKKGFCFSDVLEVHERIVREEIPCAHYVVFGGPGETEKSLLKGLENIERLQDSVVFGFVGLRILPGTALYQRAIGEGMLSRQQSLIAPSYYYSPELSRERIDEALRASFAKRQDRIYPCHELYDRIALLHQMGKTGPLWDMLLAGRRRG